MPHKNKEYKTYSDKMRRANKEALYSVIALVIIVVAWLLGGVCLSGVDAQFASTPIWIIGGTLGTWLVAVVISIVFAKRIFANFSLDDENDEIEDPDSTSEETIESGGVQ